jgi:hypothetical protein
MAKRKPNRENVSNISPTSNLSYEKYLKTALELLSQHLSVRSYKMAPKEDYPFFERGKDIRVGIFWKGKPAIDNMKRKYEFVVEVPMWVHSCTNKEDREWMRLHADMHVKCFKDAIADGKAKAKVSKPHKKKTKKKTKTTSKAGTTQVLFEEMKKQK